MMTWTRKLAVLGAGLLLTGSTLSAQTVGGWTPMGAGSLVIPFGDLGNAVGVGFGVLGGAEYRFNKDVGIRPEGDFVFYTGKNGGKSGTSFGFGATGLWHIESSGGFKPYGLFRLGLNISSGGGLSSTDLGFAPGFGGSFKCGGPTCFVEGKIYIVNSTNALHLSFGRFF